MTASRNTVRLTLALSLVAGLVGCKREERDTYVEPPLGTTVETISQTSLFPGSQAEIPIKTSSEYDENAFAVSEGKRLFAWFNCNGCHSNGGGGMGPPLMDDAWIYGSEPANIFSTIVQGRPNGMPSFRGKIPDMQVWQIAAYVRSMSGLLSKNVAPSRNDDLTAKKSENRTSPEEAASGPQGAVKPGSGQMPQ